MKTTVDIPDEELKEVIRHTQARTKRDAIVTAISEFNRRKRLEALAERLGTFESVISLEELLRRRDGHFERLASQLPSTPTQPSSSP
jgi:hypothetical protein